MNKSDLYKNKGIKIDEGWSKNTESGKDTVRSFYKSL